MPTVRVRLFAGLREIAGVSTVEAQGATVGEVVTALCQRFGEPFAEIARAGSLVVDRERATGATPLTGGEEIALLPPVSGG
jgi:MoaD family protein